MKSSIRSNDLILIGKIVGAHGIHGAVKVFAYAESPERFSRPDGLTVVHPGGGVDQWQVLWVRPRKKALCLAFKGITTRNQAEALKGCELLIPRKGLPSLKEDTYYWIDLIGMAVYDEQERCLGELVNIIETGANDVYVIKTPAEYPTGEILLPAIASVVLAVDIEQRRMRVQLPEGLI